MCVKLKSNNKRTVQNRFLDFKNNVSSRIIL